MRGLTPLVLFHKKVVSVSPGITLVSGEDFDALAVDLTAATFGTCWATAPPNSDTELLTELSRAEPVWLSLFTLAGNLWGIDNMDIC